MKFTKLSAALGAVAFVLLAFTGCSTDKAAHRSADKAATTAYNAAWAADSSDCWNLLAGSPLVNGPSGSCFNWTLGTGGYAEIEEVTAVSGAWKADGNCLAWSASGDGELPGLVSQACNGSPAQLWARTGTSPDLIWNEYYDTTYHTRCAWGSGYTHSVITADSAGGVVTLACPESTSGYTANQKWALNTVTAPAAPVGQAPAQLALPMGTCGQAGSKAAPNCIPTTDYGALVAKLTGAQMAATWDHTQTGFDGCGTSVTCTLNPVTTDQYGNAVLYTSGKDYEEASLSSANMRGAGLTQTYGIFEAAIYLSGSNGNIADFPAFWLSGVGNTWPVGGEFDIFEGLSGNAQSHYHANLGGGNVSSVAGTAESLSVPGWHIFTGVWERGYVAAYFDGVHVFDYNNTAVEGGAPLEVIVNNATGSAGSASTDYVGWFRDYAWSGQ